MISQNSGATGTSVSMSGLIPADACASPIEAHSVALKCSRQAPGKEPIPMRYVLITPVRDEVRFIELTIKSVVAQTVRPLKWVIVSDGSTDGTDDIVSK